MFRWWIPAGFMDKEEVRREIETTAAHGFRGLEICVNMADTAYSRQELAEKGWGTEHWRDMYKFILKTANDCGIQIDMTISPGWPAGVTPEDDCASKELLTSVTPVFTGRYTGPIPTETDPGIFDPNPQGGPPPMPGHENVPVPNKPVLEAVTVAR